MPVIISPRYKKKRYGINKIMYELEGLFLNSRHLENRFYQLWLGLSEYRKERFRQEVKQLIRVELLGREFGLAVAKDIIKDGEVDTKSYLYRYLKSRVYEGNLRLMLSDLQSTLERESR